MEKKSSVSNHTGFVPRYWQSKLIEKYQELDKTNFLLEACTGAGKTAGALYLYQTLKKQYNWDFLVVIVPTTYLKKQYAADAFSLFGLNLYYGGKSERTGKHPSASELLSVGYRGIVTTYSYLTNGVNAAEMLDVLHPLAGRILPIFDEVHHASCQKSFGENCEIVFEDSICKRRLMTTGTPFRSDNNYILGNWITYQRQNDLTLKCVPDFSYRLSDALKDKIIPPFSFATLNGLFDITKGNVEYNGLTFIDTEDLDNISLKEEYFQNIVLRAALDPESEWVTEAINWAWQRLKRDRKAGRNDTAVYVRGKTIRHAEKIASRISFLTGEKVLVVTSKNEPEENLGNQDLIEDFIHQRGKGDCSWIVSVNKLGEGVSIPRLKYKIHASQNKTELSFMQDLGRLLRLHPIEGKPDPVEVLIPAHTRLVKMSKDILQSIVHVVTDETTRKGNPNYPLRQKTLLNTNVAPKTAPIVLRDSTGIITGWIVDGEVVPIELTKIAEWASLYHPVWCDTGNSTGHIARLLKEDNFITRETISEYKKYVQLREEEKQRLKDFPLNYIDLNDQEKFIIAKKVFTKTIRSLTYLWQKIEPETSYSELIKKIYRLSREETGVGEKDSVLYNYSDYEKLQLWASAKKRSLYSQIKPQNQQLTFSFNANT